MELYLIGLVLAGSPAFGVQSLLLSLDGGISSTYDDKSRVVRDSSALGIAISGISLFFSSLFSLEPLFLCLFILSTTFLLGQLISFYNFNEDKKEISLEKSPSEKDIKSMLRDRSLDDLIYDGKDHKSD